ncbi:beta-propeller fold lactonase family protein [Mucilaginibacter sp.]|uniref:beta-propeller fold lactonase family protein n=1 Tax=Mucilaginibacter sp. TaxID=1882438 RepID=UPI002BD5E235|nr:beta-propeller fold lactonase family protein [Mucilaginibacter sp.]HTI58538.1 beta-propeller fold lactonase family protein [Mucilaginibacter sp.]
MKRYLGRISVIIFLLFIRLSAGAQTDQTVNNGGSTTAITFTSTQCQYNWVNNTPGIGLATSGTGNVPSFTAINKGPTAITATITATPEAVPLAYVASYTNGLVYVLNTATNTVIKTIQAGTNPFSVAASADGTRVYVANQGSGDISVINTTNNVVIATIPAGPVPLTGMAISPDGTRLYVVNQTAKTVSVINTTASSISATIPVGAGPISIQVSPDGTKVYVGNYDDGTVSVINAAANTVITTIPTGAGATGLSLSLDGTRLYVANELLDNISVISTGNNGILATVPVGMGPYNTAISPDGKRLYVVNNIANTVSVVNVSTRSVINTIQVSSGPYGISLTPDGKLAYISTVSGNNVSVLNTTTNKITGNVSAGPGLYSAGNFISPGICVSPTATFNITIKSSLPASPDISYQTPQNYKVNSAITPLTPKNIGGTVPPNIYGQVTTFAGGGAMVSIDGTGINASFSSPSGITIDQKGILYVSDYLGGAIRKVTPAGVVSTINQSQSPACLVIDDLNNLYVTEFEASYIAKIDAARVKTRYAGVGGQGAANGPAAFATFNNPGGITIDPSGNIFVADQQNNMIREISAAGIVTTFAGNKNPGKANGTGVSASFNNPDGIVIDLQGNLYVADTKNNLIRKITPAGVVTTLAGSGAVGHGDGAGLAATFNYPTGIAVDISGNLYVADFKNNMIRIISPAGTVTTLAGDVIHGNADGTGKAARFYGPLQLVTDNKGYLYVTDQLNNLIRKIALTGYTIDKPLPAGMTFDPTTGKISGTPTVLSPSTDYTVTAYNAGGSSVTVVNIAVTNDIPTIIAGTPSGNISACFGSASATPNIQQFTVSGDGLTGNITVTAPPGFEISLAPNSGYAKTVTITQSAGAVNNKILYVRSAAADPTGNISGNVTLSSPGALGQNVAVSGVVNAIPVVNPVTSQMVNEGENTTAINFTGTGNTYSWTNNTPGIGLPASGMGDITAFTAVNNSTSPVTATITVTPHTAGYAYIANYGSNTISVVNTANNTVVATIPVGTSPWGVSVSRDGTRVYVSNQGSNNVSVINTAGNAVIATIPVGTMPEGIVVSPDGTRVYVTTLTGSGITVINATNNTVVNGTIPTGSNPQGITLSPDGRKLYVVNAGDNTVSIVNTNNNAIVATIPVGSAPSNAVVTPDGRFVYVTNRGASTISVINTTTNAVIATIPVGNNPTGIAVSPDGTKVYSSDSNSSSVSVINTATNMVVSTITANYTPDGISVSADGTTLYVAGFSVDQLLIINAATGALLSTVDVGRNPGSAGNFLATGTLCPGAPVTFTITVAPTPIPVITATGSINALTTTYGTPSASASFNVSGAGMTAGILVTPPPGFEVSTDRINFSPTATVGAAGTIAPTTVYIRLSQTTNAGSYSGNIVLSSNGATSVNVATANSTVNPALLTITANNVDKPFGTALTGGPGSTAFSPFGLQNNETIGSVTITYGAGAAATDPRGFYPGAVTASNATGGIFNPANYIISYVRGGITVIVPSAITATGTPSGLNTIYGTPSSPGSFSLSGSNLNSAITVTPPTGFEVSNNNINFSSTITVGGSGNVPNTTIYLRLAATTPVGTYSGNIVMSSDGVPDVDVAIPNSTVDPASLVIAADDQEKYQGQPNPALTVTYYGFVNNEGPAVFTKPLTISTTTTLNSPVGLYPIVTGNAEAANYTITFLPGTLTVKLSPLSVQIPNAFTPNGDGVNDVWNIESLAAYPHCRVSIYSRYGNMVFQSRGYAKPWDGTVNGVSAPVGAYYYIIYPDENNIQVLSGYVAVIR